MPGRGQVLNTDPDYVLDISRPPRRRHSPRATSRRNPKMFRSPPRQPAAKEYRPLDQRSLPVSSPDPNGLEVDSALAGPREITRSVRASTNRDDPRRVGAVLASRFGRTPAIQHKKCGRPSKGDRRPVFARLPRALADAAQQHATRQGMSLNDLVGLLLSREVGVPYSDQEALPLISP